MELIELIGRIMFATMFVMSGVTHLREREGMVAYARSMDAPQPNVTVPLSGVMILLGGLSVAFGAWPDVGALLIVAFLIPTAWIMHAFWKVEDTQMRQNQQAHFMKNISLAGAALALFALYAYGGQDFFLMTEPVFSRV